MKKFFVLLLLLLLSLTGFAQEDKNLEKKFDATANELSGLSVEDFNKANNKDDSVKLKESMFSNMMSGMFKQKIAELLKENPFAKMDREDVKAMIQLRTNNLPIAKFFEENPKFLEMIVDIVRDEKAIPKFVGIINKPDKLKTYSIIIIVIFVLSFMLNLMNSKGGLGKRILKKMGIFVGAFCINIGSFFFLFKTNLDPTLQIVFRYFHI